jgi:hypothetical protein
MQMHLHKHNSGNEVRTEVDMKSVKQIGLFIEVKPTQTCKITAIPLDRNSAYCIYVQCPIVF